MANTSIDVNKSSTPAPVPHNGDLFHSMRHEMERLFDRFSYLELAPFGRDIEHFWTRGETTGMLSFNVDVAEDDKAYTITAELPGIDEKDIDVSISGDVLMLKGEKRAEKEQKNQNRYVCERSYGSFQRSFALPADVDTGKIDAKFTKGLLVLSLPKNPKAEAALKKIRVKGA
jgi:HSP20 family protein